MLLGSFYGKLPDMASAGTAKQRFRGDRLSAAREALKAATKGKRGSQAWLAFTIGAHPTSISDWERGANEPSARYAAAICAIPELGLALSDLFGSDDDEEPEPVAFGDVLQKMFESAVEAVVDRKMLERAAPIPPDAVLPQETL